MAIEKVLSAAISTIALIQYSNYPLVVYTELIMHALSDCTHAGIAT